MATRVVERGLSLCRSILIGLFTENGYQLEETYSEKLILHGEYTKAKKHGLLYRPLVRAELDSLPLSLFETQVALSFPKRWSLQVILTLLLILIGIAPAIILLTISDKLNIIEPYDSIRKLLFGGCGIWALLITWILGSRTNAVNKHCSQMQNLAWERLDPSGSASSEIALPTPSNIKFWGATKWISLILLVIVGLLLFLGMPRSIIRWESPFIVLMVGIVIFFCLTLLAMYSERMINSDSPYQTMSDFRFWSAARLISLILLVVVGLLLFLGMLRSIIKWESPSILLVVGILIFPCLALLTMYSEWVTCSWSLAHRYHWKTSIGALYMKWWLFVCFPGLCLFGLAMIRHASISYFENTNFNSTERWPLILVLFGLILVYGLLIMSIVRMLRIRKNTQNKKYFFVVPSTRYEWLSEPDDEIYIILAKRKYRLWTWAIFLSLGTLWYLNAGYLSVTFLTSLASILGIGLALESSAYWPVIISKDVVSAAFQSLLLTFLAGIPVVLTVTRAFHERLNLHRKLKLAREFAGSSPEPALPSRPLSVLKKKLQAEVLLATLVPTTEINVKVERTSIFRREYLLCITVGAYEYLSQKQLEALLFHECGHADLFKRTCWRELGALLAPWGPRFLDLTEDLYHQERKADRYVVLVYDLEEPLLSALKKMKDQQNSAEKTVRFPNVVKMLWNMGWTGYVYPDVDQRIFWIKGYCEPWPEIENHDYLAE